MNKNLKKDIPVALFAGLICGIVCAAALAFIDAKKIWLSVPIALAMAVFSFLQTALDKKLSANRYEKAEKEIIGRKMSGISLFVFCAPITV